MNDSDDTRSLRSFTFFMPIWVMLCLMSPLIWYLLVCVVFLVSEVPVLHILFGGVIHTSVAVLMATLLISVCVPLRTRLCEQGVFISGAL